MAIDGPGQAPIPQSQYNNPTIAALMQQAQALFNQGNNVQALAAYEQAANLGSVFCMTQAAGIYAGQLVPIKGVPPPLDFAKAASLLRMAIAAGKALGTPDGMSVAANAERFIGYLYSIGGPNLPADLAQARAWIQQAIADGDPTAQQLLNSLNPAPAPAPAAPAPAPQQAAPQQGICAAVYIVAGEDSVYGTHMFYGAAWSRSSYADALAGAKSELLKVATANEVDPRELPDAGGQYAATPQTGSGCTYAHGAVAGKLKIAPSGSSIWNPGGAGGTSPLGPGIYDIIAANFADSTDAAVSAAMSQCQTTDGPGNNDAETCTVLQQW
jgi:hypothetical protein